jgi:hypothetical protein
MLHACFYTIYLVFRYTSWHFYAISGTNLLTRCHSASSLFSAIFVFQKSYIGNILGIGRNKSRTSGNSPKLPENRRGDGVGPRGPHTIGRRGLASGRAPYVWGRPGSPLTMPLRLYKASGQKTLGSRRNVQNSSAALPPRRQISGDRSLCSGTLLGQESAPEPSPSVSIAGSAVSIDLTAISINLAISYDEEGVVLPRGWGLYR